MTFKRSAPSGAGVFMVPISTITVTPKNIACENNLLCGEEVTLKISRM
jgi:hypothetical protein